MFESERCMCVGDKRERGREKERGGGEHARAYMCGERDEGVSVCVCGV